MSVYLCGSDESCPCFSMRYPTESMAFSQESCTRLHVCDRGILREQLLQTWDVRNTFPIFKLQKIEKFKRTKLQSSICLRKKGLSMSLDFPASSLQDDVNIVISNSIIQMWVERYHQNTVPAIGNIINLMPHGQIFDTCVTLSLTIRVHWIAP